MRAAVERGVTFFDTAEAYGPFANIGSVVAKITVQGARYPDHLKDRVGR